MANINEVVCNLWKQYRGDCKMKKKTIVWIIVVVVIIALGIMVVKRAKKRDAESPVAKTYSMVVSTIKPELKEVTLSLCPTLPWCRMTMMSFYPQKFRPVLSQ